jgi:hypothetical protein
MDVKILFDCPFHHDPILFFRSLEKELFSLIYYFFISDFAGLPCEDSPGQLGQNS